MTEPLSPAPATPEPEHVKLDIQDILRILPHRHPFLLIDRVIDLTRKERIVAIKNVTINEPFFQGHFPGLPIMPGVFIVQAIAQAGGARPPTAMPYREPVLVGFSGRDEARGS